jgi:nucleotide-binding universal stress UspA family protein
MATQHTILVPVTNSPASLQAVTVACGAARARKSKVYAVHVIEVLRSLPLNAEMESEARRGEQLLRKAEEVAHAAGYQVVGELLQAREAGQAIVEEAAERQADMIVLGIGNGHRPGNQFDIGRAAQFVLKHAKCEVWVIRQGVNGHVHPEREQGKND